MIDKERAKFEEWFKAYGNPDLCKDAQWHGFLGRAHLARKSQNDPTQEKSYRVTYLDNNGQQTYRYEMAKTPKAAEEIVKAAYPRAVVLYARRDERRTVQ